MTRNPLLPLLFILCTGLAGLLANPVLADAPLPRHRISLSFELGRSLVNGTSQLLIPVDTPLQLDCGPLQLTGLVLEQQGRTPQTLKRTGSNILSLPAATVAQILTVSWQLQVPAPGENDNLISPEGVTLAGFWHPVADRDQLFSLEALIPRDFEAISEADTIRTELRSGGKRVTTSFAQPLRNLHFVAGPYVIQSKQLGNLTLSTYLFREDAALAKAYLEKTAGLIDRYQRTIGPFPYQRFAVVENRLPTGYGLPTFTLMGQAVIRLQFIMERSLGHEVLHSWFGNSVQVKESNGNWSEGLTTYLADQSFAADAKKGPAFRKEQLIRYRAYVHPVNAIPLNAFQNTGDSQPVGRAMRAIGYDKASMVFHMLQLHIGETAIQKGLQHFYQQMRGKSASWQDLEAAFSRSSGKLLHSFFQQWLERTDLPRIAIENSTIDQRKGRAILTFDLVQDNPAPFLLDVPVRITTLRGETTRTLHTDSSRKAVTIELDSLPTSLVVDDGYDLLRHLDAAELPATWSQFLGAEEKTVIAPPDELLPAYQPLIDVLRRAGCRVVAPAEVSNSDLARGSWMFLGDSAARRSQFAGSGTTAKGFTLDVRRSPLNRGEVMVLVDCSSHEETSTVAGKLDHYGTASRLRFIGGKNLEKTTATTADGIVLPLIDKPQGLPMQATRSFEEIIDDLVRARVVYVGETHTDYGNHLLQLQILQALHARDKKMVVGLEMFPRSSQQALDDYVQGKIDERRFLTASNYFEVWGFDYRLYRDIIAYARAQRIPLIGLNLDKAISRQVFATGATDTLTPEQQAQIAGERDLDMPGYQQRLQAVHSQHASPHGSGFAGFLQAQALWDETMAESIVKALERYPGHQLLVLAGNGHVGKDNGIPPRVHRRVPGVTQRVVAAAGSMERGEGQVDYLMFAQPIELTPAGKLGVILKEEGREGEPGRVGISGLSPQGQAGKAGLATEDRILSLDDQEISSIADLKISLLDKKAGEVVQVRILRNRRPLTFPVELSSMETGAMPPAHPPP